MVIVTGCHEIYIPSYDNSEKENRETMTQKTIFAIEKCIQDNHNVHCIILKTADNI